MKTTFLGSLRRDSDRTGFHVLNVLGLSLGLCAGRECACGAALAHGGDGCAQHRSGGGCFSEAHDRARQQLRCMEWSGMVAPNYGRAGYYSTPTVDGQNHTGIGGLLEYRFGWQYHDPDFARAAGRDPSSRGGRLAVFRGADHTHGNHIRPLSQSGRSADLSAKTHHGSRAHDRDSGFDAEPRVSSSGIWMRRSRFSRSTMMGALHGADRSRVRALPPPHPIPPPSSSDCPWQMDPSSCTSCACRSI
jgi:hypothetical protein